MALDEGFHFRRWRDGDDKWTVVSLAVGILAFGTSVPKRTAGQEEAPSHGSLGDGRTVNRRAARARLGSLQEREVMFLQDPVLIPVPPEECSLNPLISGGLIDCVRRCLWNLQPWRDLQV